ncbi:MAG: MDR family MFS transporter [Actinomycetota bacterium]|nr:MDR family MFS transporter [Actinomycetota bacterium]
MTDEPEPSTERVGLAYQWKAMWIVLLGTFMVVLDTTIVSLGLTSVANDLGAAKNIEWVVTSYIVALGVSQLTSGWLGDRFGRARVYVVALGVFTVGSLACSLAPGFGWLIAARALQGVGGGLVVPIAMAIIYDLFEPRERGKAIGYFSIAVMAAPAIGPVLGGTMVSSIGWRWLFLVNVPIGLIAIPVTSRLLRASGTMVRRPLDRLGFGVVAAGLVLLLVGLQQGGSWGWGSASVLAFLVAGLGLTALFVVRALRIESPLAEVRIFGNPVFSLALLVMSLSTLAQYMRLIYIPMELEGVRGIEASTVGWLMMPSAVGMAFTLPIGGRLVDRLGGRVPSTIGLLIVAAAYWPLSNLGQDTSLWTISILLFIGGLGSGIGMTAPNVISINAVRATQVGQATALSQVGRQITLAMGLAVLASVYVGLAPARGNATPPTAAEALRISAESMHAYNMMFRIAFWILIAVVLLAQFLPAKATSQAMQERLAAERDALRADGHLAESVSVIESA